MTLDTVDNPSGDDYAKAAREALDQAHLREGIICVAAALAFDPNREAWLELMDAILERADDPLALVEVDRERPFFGLVAVRAWALARVGRVDDALALILEVATYRPAIPYLRWAKQWVQRHAKRKVDLNRVGAPLSRFVQELGRGDDDERRRTNVEAAVELTRTLRTQHPDRGEITFLETTMLRWLGRSEDALAIALQEDDRRPSYFGAVEIACAHRDLGNIDGAIAFFRKALEHDSSQLAPHLDIGDMLLNEGRFSEAAEAYQRALEQQPTHPWAHPSSLYARHLTSSHPGALAELEALASQEAEPGRATALLRDLMLLESVLPRPQDLSADAVESAIGQIEASPSRGPGITHQVNVTVTHPESPSVGLAFAQAMTELGEQAKLHIEVERIPNPDPREPRGEVDFVLWRYRDDVSAVALPPPESSIVAAVADLATTDFDEARWYEAAREAAAPLADESASAIAAAMVHPPAKRPSHIPPLDWVYRVQVATAFVLARLDDGWQAARRRRALLTVARGPADWSVAAALVALSAVAQRSREAAEELANVFAELDQGIPDDSFSPYAYTLTLARLRLPQHRGAPPQPLWQRKRRLENARRRSAFRLRQIDS